jgi:hypothetical protein
MLCPKAPVAMSSGRTLIGGTRSTSRTASAAEPKPRIFFAPVDDWGSLMWPGGRKNWGRTRQLHTPLDSLASDDTAIDLDSYVQHTCSAWATSNCMCGLRRLPSCHGSTDLRETISTTRRTKHVPRRPVMLRYSTCAAEAEGGGNGVQQQQLAAYTRPASPSYVHLKFKTPRPLFERQP